MIKMNENKRFMDIVWGNEKEAILNQPPAEPTSKEATKVIFDFLLPISNLETTLQEILTGENPAKSLASLLAFAGSMSQTLNHPSFEDGTRSKLDDLTRCAQMAYNVHTKEEGEVPKEELQEALAKLSKNTEKFIHEMREIQGKTNARANQISKKAA